MGKQKRGEKTKTPRNRKLTHKYYKRNYEILEKTLQKLKRKQMGKLNLTGRKRANA